MSSSSSSKAMVKGSLPTTAVKSAGSLPTAPVTCTPSSSAVGFFQSPPEVQNQFHEDVAFQRFFARKC
jgi:hypothetical protein